MKFSTKEDVEAPIEHVFAKITDFDSFERMALRRGADIQRTHDDGAPGVGMSWAGKVDIRGKTRDITAQVARFDTPTDLILDGESDGFDIHVEVELVALSPRRTRMRVEFELGPRTLSARLVIQSAKLARRNLTHRYKEKVAGFAIDMEKQYKASRPV
ncbi:MAG: SRPBCC family protein [Brevirhabdus sp.]